MVQIASLTKIATLDRDIANLRLITNDTTAEGVKRLEAANKVEELIAKKYDLQLAMKREERDIQQQRNDLGENAIEDEEAIAKLNAELITLAEQRANEERAVLRIKGTVIKEVEALKKAEIDALWAVQDARTQAQAEELIGRQAILAEIDNATKTNVDKLYDELNEKLNAYAWSAEEELRITSHYADLINEAEQAKILAQQQADRELYESKLNSVTNYVSQSLDALGVLSQFNEAAMQKELAAAGDNEEAKDAIRKKYAKKQKAMMIAEAIVGTALAVISAMATKPFIPMGLIAAGLAGAMGAAQVATIAATPMATGGIIPPGYPNDTYPALLSSGETVIPPRALATSGGQLTARVSRRDLLFILDEANAERGRTW
jgi:hypothetical protein